MIFTGGIQDLKFISIAFSISILEAFPHFKLPLQNLSLPYVCHCTILHMYFGPSSRILYWSNVMFACILIFSKRKLSLLNRRHIYTCGRHWEWLCFLKFFSTYMNSLLKTCFIICCHCVCVTVVVMMYCTFTSWMEQHFFYSVIIRLMTILRA